MPPSFDEIKRLVAPFEGNLPHMYVDTKGFVTVGIGNMLPNAKAAQQLAFVNRTTKNSATEVEIATDFDNVAKQPKARAARWYRQFTALDLPDAQVNRLFQNRIDEFRGQLRRAYPKYDSYPNDAQLALLDMAFNLGVGAVKKKWPKLNEAIDKLDWAAASERCERPEANAIRNASVTALFKRAAGKP